jgi:hypothetical protein
VHVYILHHDVILKRTVLTVDAAQPVKTVKMAQKQGFRDQAQLPVFVC